MSPRGLVAAFSRFSRPARRHDSQASQHRQARQHRNARPATRAPHLAAELLESRCMLSATARLENNTSMFDRIPVIHGSQPANPGGSFVGQFFWNGSGFKSFCVEGQQSISPGLHTFPTVTSLSISGLANADLVEQFWRSYGPTTTAGFTSVTDAAAFQLGIWELISDGPSRDLKSGSFRVGDSASPAVARAESWLNGTGTPAAGAGGSVPLHVMQHPTMQDQVIWGPLPPPSVSVKVTPTSVTEDGSNKLTYAFTASPAPTADITVNYRIGGSAKAGSDFTGLPPGATTGTITIPAGSTSPVTLTIVPTADTEIEPNETVILTLQQGAGYALGTSVATGTIENDDYLVDLVLDGLPEETAPVPNELAPGAILPIGGDRISLIANVPAGRTATLAIAKGAVRVYDQQAGGNPVLGPPGQPSIEVVGGQPRPFWVEAITPGVNLADIELTLTAVVSAGRQTPPPSDKVRATAVDTVVSIKAIDDVAHEQYRDTGTFVITRERGNLDTLIPVQIIVSGDADYNWHYRLNPDLPPLPVGGHAHSSTISLLPGVDRLIVTLTPLREDRDNHERKAVLELVPPQIPLYAVAKGYDKAEVTIIPDPQDGDLEITGTITYAGPKGVSGGSTLTLGALPVRGAKVEIWDDNGSLSAPQLVATAYTDDNGKYAVRISSVDTVSFGQYVDPYVVVVAQSAPETVDTKTVATIAHQVSIAGESSPARKEFIDNVVPRGPGRAVLDGAMTNADADDGRRNAAFSVFDAIHSASRYHVTLPGVKPGTVKAMVGAAKTQYDSNTNKIEIKLEDRFSWDTIGHEYGHFAHDHAGVTLGVGGDHGFSENLRFRDYSAAWRKAFTEGFATYFSIVAQARTPKPPAGVAGFGDTAYWSVEDLSILSHTDLEAEGRSTPAGKGAKYGSLGEDNEVSVFRTLWDLYDPANDDPIGDIGEIGVWNLVATGKAQTMPAVKFLYQDLIAKASIVRKWEIGKVLAEHKIVPSPLRVDLHGATPLESLDNPPTFVISALYGSDYGQHPNKWLFKNVQIRFYTSTGLLLDVLPGSTNVPPPADLPAEISWTPSKDLWAKVMVAWVGEPIRWSVLATTELTDSGVLSQYESFSQMLTFA